MKRIMRRALVFVLLLSILCSAALADRVAISMGGKLGLMHVGDTVTLHPKVRGISEDALDWSSSDASVAAVSGGTLLAKAAGRAVISASAGGKKAKCGVVVLPRSVEIEVGMSYRLPNGTLEGYAVRDRGIAGVSKSGEISGISAGSTVVGVRYGKQMLTIDVKVTDGWSKPDQSAAAALDCASDVNQIVLVEHQKGSSARLSIHEKQAGAWREIYNCTAYVGSNGIGKTREGDRRTPTGTYNLTQPFGILPDPGAGMPYTQVTKYHYWCGSSGSKYYNQMVDTRRVDRSATANDEKLINYGAAYNYCLFIDYNASGESGKGSCIFLHCNSGKNSTAGCISVPEKVMKRIVQWAKPGAKIVIR